MVLPASFYRVKFADRAVSLVLDNPPYGFNKYINKRRHRIHRERLFVPHMMHQFSAGGSHLILIPLHPAGGGSPTGSSTGPNTGAQA